MEKNKTKMTFFSFKTFFHVIVDVVVVVVSVKMFHIIKYAHLNESFSLSHLSDNEASMQSNMTTSYFSALTRTSVNSRHVEIKVRHYHVFQGLWPSLSKILI